MARASLYDRISAKRIADEEAARKAALDAPAVVAAPEPEPDPVTPLQEVPSSFSFGGLHLAFPETVRFLDVQATVEYKGQPLRLNIKRCNAVHGEGLETLFKQSVQAFYAQDPELRLIRQRDCTLLGCAAKALDFHFKVGHTQQHARLVGALVPLEGSDALQWLEIACLIDPTQPDVTDWLVAFDSMLFGLVGR